MTRVSLFESRRLGLYSGSGRSGRVARGRAWEGSPPAAGDEVGGGGVGVVDDQDVGAVGVADRLGGDDLGGRSAGDDPAVGHQVGLVAEQGGQTEVVQGGEHGNTEAGDQLEYLQLVADVQMVRGLVEDEMIGSLGDGAGDQRPLFFPAGEGVVAAVGEIRASDPFEGVGDRCLDLGCYPARNCACGGCVRS